MPGCCAAAGTVGYMLCCCLLFIYLFDDSDQLYQNLPDQFSQNFYAWTVTVDNQSEIIFLFQGTLLWRSIFVSFYPQKLLHSYSPDGSSCVVSFNNMIAGCRRLVAQPGGLKVGLLPCI